MQSPRRVAKVVLAFVICSTIFSDYWEYSGQYHADPNAWMDIIHGTGGAPMQYRIGVVRFADLLRRHGHMGLRHAFTFIDLLCAAVAVYLLFSLLERAVTYRAVGETARWFGAAVFVCLVQYNFAWIRWYQRPETMASAAVLAATLWLLTVPLRFSQTVSILVTSASMLALAGIQGFIRADVAVVAHLGILLVCATRRGSGLSLPWGLQALVSGGALLVAGGIQFYLIHVAFPHATYGTTPVFQLIANLTLPIRWIPTALFMMPWMWLVITLLRRSSTTSDSPGIALVVGSAIYVVLWSVVGKIDEVRIFLPYALALIPLTCVCATQRFLTPRTGTAILDF